MKHWLTANAPFITDGSGMLYQVFGRVPARIRQFVPFVQSVRSRFTYEEKNFSYAKVESLLHLNTA